MGFLSRQDCSISSKLDELLIIFFYFDRQTHDGPKSKYISNTLSSTDFVISSDYLPSEVHGVTMHCMSAEVWYAYRQHQMFYTCSQVPGTLFPAIYQQFILTGYSFLYRELQLIVHLLELMIHFEKEFIVAHFNSTITFLLLVLIP